MIELAFKSVEDGTKVRIVPTNGALSPLLNVPETQSTPEPEAKELKIGDQMEDGTIYGGISPETQANIFVLPSEPYTMKIVSAFNYAAAAGGFRLPTAPEISMLMEHDKNGLIEIFNNEGIQGSRYWVSNEVKSRDGISGLVARRTHNAAITYPNSKPLFLANQERAGLVLVRD